MGRGILAALSDNARQKVGEARVCAYTARLCAWVLVIPSVYVDCIVVHGCLVGKQREAIANILVNALAYVLLEKCRFRQPHEEPRLCEHH